MKVALEYKKDITLKDKKDIQKLLSDWEHNSVKYEKV